ncbi:hypothetical protein BCR37DRAFT_387883 [Protomyces lactucae-debilis]|uniref:Uncharacterized protein n=1 Tax=Protomyces lactucae-debilis TaxID=2754530 RepID=A0A1Y2FA98_PROLT|nr:uncharacterized protein BCR37DRAFT_387883 [Protomyces lactucae-debilis]ORY80838.1 hypothetical protein BCR37DRAFT_387883 [Protomyces lactucae-debilis]
MRRSAITELNNNSGCSAVYVASFKQQFNASQQSSSRLSLMTSRYSRLLSIRRSLRNECAVLCHNRPHDLEEITQQTFTTLMIAFGDVNAEHIAALTALQAAQTIAPLTGSTLPPPHGKPSDTLVSVRERAESWRHNISEVAGRYGGKGQRVQHCMQLCDQIARQASSATQEILEMLFADDSQCKGPAAVSHSAKQRNSAMAFYGYKGKVIAAYCGMMLDTSPSSVKVKRPSPEQVEHWSIGPRLDALSLDLVG